MLFLQRKWSDESASHPNLLCLSISLSDTKASDVISRRFRYLLRQPDYLAIFSLRVSEEDEKVES